MSLGICNLVLQWSKSETLLEPKQSTKTGVFIFVLFACLLFGSTAFADGARIKFDKKTHDFGNLVDGDKVKASFKFTNTGDAELQIRKLKTTCGCTAAVAARTTILPGQKSSIDLVFDTKGKRGKLTLPITVYTNAKHEGVVNLSIKADVTIRLETNPRSVHFDRLPLGKSAFKTVTIKNNTKRPIRLVGIKSSRPEIIVHLKKKIVPAKGSIDFQVEVAVPQNSNYSISGRVEVITVDKSLPKVNLGIMARVLTRPKPKFAPNRLRPKRR